MSARPMAVTIVWVDHPNSTWLALYLDGHKVYEGHPPELDDALPALGIQPEVRTFPSEKLADLSRMRGMPRELPRVGFDLVPA